MNEMSPAEEVFFAALEKGTHAEQTAYLERACAGNPALRARVEKLLAAHPRIGGFLEPPSPTPRDASGTVTPDVRLPEEMTTGDLGSDGATDTFGDASPIGHGIGLPAGTIIASRYTLLEVLGEGGMGTVYRASQTEPVKRQVALKLIKSGMDSKAVLARFDSERQALALMDHPNIARIYDGGVTLSGQPFFVMELVKGVPLTEYCDTHRLALDDRLQLFVSVCQAVQHAHQKGIIHRDLKPGNVLVTEFDGRSTPKVIDFGVAKATELKLTDLSFSDIGAIVGTPAYMSPEQTDPTSMDVDTRTDVYALGVMLYELLTGSPPLDAKQFKRGAVLEMLRMVREVEPLRPSTKLGTVDALPTIAANRCIEPAKLARLLQGELDWVVMKAIDKDRNRRYDTANGLARDVQRYLADEVVEARPPSRGYRLKKFVKRNKGQVIAASLVLVTLLAGTMGTACGFFEAKRQEQEAKRQERIARDEAVEKELARHAEAERAEAEHRARLEAQAARDEEARERNYAEAIARFVTDDFLALTSVEGQRRFGGEELSEDATLHTLLDRAAEKLKDRTGLAPRTEAELLWIVGVSYRAVGEPERGIPFLERSVEVNRGAFGPKAEVTLRAQNSLAAAYCLAERYDRAVPLLEETLAVRTANLGPEHPSTLVTAANLAGAYHGAGQYQQVLPLAEVAFRALMAQYGPDHPKTLMSMSNLAEAYLSAGKRDLAVPLFEQVYHDTRVKRGPVHSDTLSAMNALAKAYRLAGKRDLAVPLFEQVLQLRTDQLGHDHRDTLVTMGLLGALYREIGRNDLALPLIEKTVELRKQKLGPEHRSTLDAMGTLAAVYRSAGKRDLALALYERTFVVHRAKLGPDHPVTLTSMNNLAGAYWWANELDKSVPLFEQTLKLKETKFGRAHPDTLMTVANLGVNYKDAGRVAEAIPLLEEAHQAKTKYPELRFVDGHLSEAYARVGEKRKLADLLREQVTEARKLLPPDSPQLAQHLATAGRVLLQARAFSDAENLLRECFTIRQKTQSDAWSTFNTQSTLGEALMGQRKYAEAEPLLLKGYEGMKVREKTIPGSGKIRIPEALDRLIELYTATNKPDEVKKWRAERAKHPNAAPMPREKK